MISDTLHDAVAEIDRYLADPVMSLYYDDPLIHAEILAARAVMDALRMRLDAPPPAVCVPGCLRAALEGAGHAGACVAPPSTWPPVARR